MEENLHQDENVLGRYVSSRKKMVKSKSVKTIKTMKQREGTLFVS
jgi:hypothetical protein